MVSDRSSGLSIIGIDFSGAKDSGRKIWIATAAVQSGHLHIEECCRADHLLGTVPDRDAALDALRQWIGAHDQCIVGLDFPFSLPQSLMIRGWEQDVLSLGDQFAPAEAFREDCWRRAGDRELKRITDQEEHAPFSPYNLRLYRQTFYGLRDLLSPLLTEKAVCVLPMQHPIGARPWIIEICPASTLRRERLQTHGYKGRKEHCRNNRAEIVKTITTNFALALSPEIRDCVVGDSGGDALDAVLAAVATYRARSSNECLKPADQVQAVEGRIFS